jgi:iron complex transport system permease protein
VKQNPRALDDFLRRERRKSLVLLLLLAITALWALFAVTRGAYRIGFANLVHSLAGLSEGVDGVVLWKIRLPRIAASLSVGWGLAMAGLFTQTLLRNPIGSPSTLGISQGAAFGASLAIIFLGSRLLSVAAFAFLGAAGATALILMLARIKRLSPEAVILAGVALSSLFGAATVLIQYLADETRLATAVVWSFGDVGRSSWTQIGLLSAVTALAWLFGFAYRWDFNALDSGEESARGLGVAVERLRFQGMAVAALVAALATAFHGVIAFVGLIAPHIARRFVQADHRFLLPATGALGALLLLASDTCGKLLIGSAAFPVGVITSFLGAPLFLYLLLRGSR